MTLPDAVPLRTRLHTDGKLLAGAEVALDAERARQLGSVLRLAPGARLALFNAADGEWAAELVRVGKAGAVARCLTQRRPPADPGEVGPWLLFAPVKRAPLDWLVEKATELGVGRLLPVDTARTQVERVRTDRLALIAREAAEQTERLDVPEVAAPEALFAALDGWDPGRPLFVAAEAGAARPAAGAFADLAPGTHCALLTGPEGGFEPRELALLTRLPFVRPIGLGPRLLRAETAALAALSVWQAVAGDWRGGDGTDRRPPFRG